jgi:outer membrane protein assembly factor BamB
VTCGTEEQGTRNVIGLDAATGRQRWRHELRGAVHRKHQLNSFASSTPAMDDQGVYVVWGTPQAFVVEALDHAGVRRWQVDLGSYRSGHGEGASPMVYGNLVVVAKEHEGESEIVALDRQTGRTHWRVPRRSKSTWATPCVFTSSDGRDQLICTSWEHGISALDPADGKTIWEADIFAKEHIESTIASPVVADGILIASSGWLAVRQEVIAVRPGPNADRLYPAWERKYCIDRSAPLCTTPLVVGRLLFLWADDGIVTCADLQSGNVHWRQRVGGTYYASPIGVGGNVYNISTEGDVVVLAAAKEYRQVARNVLGEPSHSTAAVVDGVLYLRTFSRLLAIGAANEN